MALIDNILLKIKTKHWTLFYYVAHVIAIICALALISVSYLAHKAEVDTVGSFDLNITFNISVMFYAAGGLMLMNAVIGFLAQRFPDKPSLWILFCIVLAILSAVVLTASVTATSRSKSSNFPVSRMKLTMEDYDLTSPNSTQWDRMQEKFKCCGTEDYKDWQDVHFGRTSLRVPTSCCLPEKKTDELCGLNVLPHDDNAHEKIYSRGCIHSALSRVQALLTLLSTLGLSICATNLMFAMLSCYVVVTKKI